MPSIYAEPTIQDLLDAFEDGVRAQRDKHVDAREGSVYQHFSGSAAILWARAARRTTDLWRAVYLDSAESNDLTALLADRYNFARVEDTHGVGSALLRRPSVAGADGTIWAGTRLEVLGTERESKRYVVAVNTPVGATDNTVEVPVRAERAGGSVAISVSGEGAARLTDPLWDPSWMVARLDCADGTSFEPAAAARARLRDTRRAARAGFVEAIVQACRDAGAANALLFPSDYGGEADDRGLNMAYVGDAGFQGDEQLVRRVTIALERWRVLGDNLQVRLLGGSNLVVNARVYLWDSPARVNQVETQRLLRGALLGQFTGPAAFSYSRDALEGAMRKAAPVVQSVEFDAPTSDAAVLSIVGGLLNFPATLNRYNLAPNDITLTLLPPL
jgi:hypothetical protein